MGVKELRERWRDTELVARGWAVLRGEKAEFPSVDGRIDLRGIPGPPSATAAEPWRPAWIEGVVLAGLDLSHAAFGEIRMMNVELRDCVLDRADLRRSMINSGAWIGCRMVGVDLREAHLSGGDDRSGWPPLRIEAVDLTAAKAQQASWRNVELSRVCLDRASLARPGSYAARSPT